MDKGPNEKNFDVLFTYTQNVFWKAKLNSNLIRLMIDPVTYDSLRREHYKCPL